LLIFCFLMVESSTSLLLKMACQIQSSSEQEWLSKNVTIQNKPL
jgi:hypothetical protein